MVIRIAKAGCVALAAITPWLVSGYPGGPPIRRTGAPGDRTCLDASCHVGTLLEDSAAVRLETSANFTYMPGGPRQRWILEIDDSSARAFGFQMSVRTRADPSDGVAGQLHDIEPDTQVVCDNQVLAGSCGCVPPTLVQFAQHTNPREQNAFVLEWTPPAENLGDVIVYVAANASVTGQRNSRIHLRSFVIQPTVASGVVDGVGLRSQINAGSLGSLLGIGPATSTRSARPSQQFVQLSLEPDFEPPTTAWGP